MHRDEELVVVLPHVAAARDGESDEAKDSDKAGLEPQLVLQTVLPAGPKVAEDEIPDRVEHNVDRAESDDAPADPAMEPRQVLLRDTGDAADETAPRDEEEEDGQIGKTQVAGAVRR